MLTIQELEDQAQTLQEAGSDDALAACKKLLKRDADNIIAHFHLALIYRHKNRPRKSLQHALRVRKLNLHEGNIHLNLGAIYSDLGKMDKAIRCYKRELKQDPDNAQTLLNLGNRYFCRGCWKTAARYYQKSFDLDFEIEKYVFDLAECYEKSGQVKQEIALYKRYLQQFPHDVGALQNLGGAFIDVGKYDKSLRYSRQAQQFPHDKPMVKRHIKLALKLKRKRDKKN